MNIEEAIQQKKPFKSPWQRATVNLMFTNNWVVNQIKSQLKPYGITLQQYNVLRILRGAGQPISTSIIRERLLDKMADSSRMVDRLYQKGLVDRKACPNDKRLVDVSLSPKGLNFLEDYDKKTEEMDEILNRLTKEEAVVLNNLLDKIRS